MNTPALTGHLVRREAIDTARTIVVKVGTNVLSLPGGGLNRERIEALAEQIHRLKQAGKQVILVSSGAVGAGMALLDLKVRPTTLPELQAVAAAGQARMIRHYDQSFREYGFHAGQMLLTSDDFESRDRYVNVRNTLQTLLNYNVVPVVNENDTISTDEIAFSDNDQLAAFVTHIVDRPLLVILSVVDGLLDGHPDDPNSKSIRSIGQWDESLLSKILPTKSEFGTGGMVNKIQAVRRVTKVGESVIIADGRDETVLDKILHGQEVGTLFVAEGPRVLAWKRWIGYTSAPKGMLKVDQGACEAIRAQGKSLLPIGVTEVEGDFREQEIVGIVDPQGHEFARGLTNFSASEVRTIARLPSSAIQERLGTNDYLEVIHRDNLVVYRLET